MTTASGTDRAVVVGGGMAGLLAARVLADHVGSVLVLDRDELPREPVARGGVPQGRHSHGLLARGREVLEQLLPGLTEDLVTLGASVADVEQSTTIYVDDRPMASSSGPMRGLRVSRPLLEWYVRQRVAALPRVEILDGTSVLDLRLSADLGTVTGVVVEPTVTRNGVASSRVEPAALVVDAAGRNARTPEWLERRGYPAPPEERVRVDVMYATRLFRRAEDPADTTRVVICPPTPRTPRGAVAIAQEGGRWTVSLAGYHGDRPPLDLPGFVAFARSCCSTAVGDLVADLEPLDDGAVFRFPANTRHYYEQVERFPDGLLVVGDALCAFDPVFGQGMTVAALEVAELGRCLAEGRAGLARRFFARAAEHVDTPWTLVVGSIRQLPGATEPMTRKDVLVQRYVQALRLAAIEDPVLARAFHEVVQMVQAPPSLMTPRYAVRVARSALTRSVAAHTGGQTTQTLTSSPMDAGQYRSTPEEHTEKATGQ